MQTKDTTSTLDRLLTKEDVAGLFQVTTRAVDNWMKEGVLPYFKIGRRTVRFNMADVKQAIASRRVS